ncbi:MAG TPA: hypothetical protein PLM00_00230 [Spirochaetota bacterium]|nr:hypothetical protein [Spirochaetota bacterium]
MQTRMIMGVVLAVCAVIFIAQNMSDATFKILFITIQMPALIFYVLLLVIGFGLGIVVKSKK